MARPLASVIVVARDEEENIRRCLTAVREQRVGFDYEIIVIDSGSVDATAQAARSFGAAVTTIPRSSFQHGRTRQMASELARSQYLVYLVADAVPADERWMEALVEAVASDDRVAGAYSRQLPRDGAGPIEAWRLIHRLSSGTEREVREIGPDDDFWAWSAEQRFRYCEFDDVSCCRRRSLLDRFPIPEVDWAEDLLWARQVLLHRYKIVLEPKSRVKHSHPDTVSHAFRRGWLDQAVVKQNFGVLYFDGIGQVARGYPRLLFGQTKAVMRAEIGAGAKLGAMAGNVVRLASEVAGNFLASREQRDGHVVCDLAQWGRRAFALRGIRRGQVLRTRFTLGADTRPVLFMNPPAEAAKELRIPRGARLVFSAGINPQARPFRREPVDFMVAVDGEPVWSRSISPGQPGEEPSWVEGAVDLGPWEGRRARIALVTRAQNTDYAWAGWGAPRILVDKLSTADRGVNALLQRTQRFIQREPLRHP